MGSKPQKQPDPPKSTVAQLEEQIPVYNRPPSPIVDNNKAKIQGLGIRPDDNIDREANNKQQADRQRRSKVDASPKIDIPKKKQQSPPKQQNKPFVISNESKQPQLNKTLDLSYDLFVGGLNQKDLKELERQLENDDLSPINESNTESQKQALDEQKIKVAEQKIWKLQQKIKRTFNWPSKGSVTLASVQFKYSFQHNIQKLSVTHPYDNYVNSILSWQNNTQLRVYEFKLRDIDIYNTTNGDVVQLKFNEVEFMVDYNGVFIGIKHESDYLFILQSKTSLVYKITK